MTRIIMEAYQWIDGAIAVEAVLQAGSRPVSDVLIRQDRYDGAAARIERLAGAAGVAVARVPAEALRERAAGGDTATVIARVGARRTVELDALMGIDGAALVMLDGLEDPFNFGQAVRSLYAAGIDGLVLRPRNWLGAAATVTRASAGATEWMPTAVAEAGDVVAAARARRLPIVVAEAGGVPMDEADLAGPLLLVIGGEKRGVGRPLRQAADWRVAIPYGRDFPHALGAAAAATALAFELLRRRRGRG